MRRVMFTALFIAGMAGVVGAQSPDAKNDAKKIEAGQKIYETQKCATCHAIKGAGGKLASALDGAGTRLTDGDLKKWLTVPAEMEAKLKTKPKMPMSTFMKTHKLADADVDALVAYMKTLK